MIWYREPVAWADQPPHNDAHLVGTFVSDRSPAIAIDLVWGNPTQTLRLFQHDPSGRLEQEPEPDQILARYRTKVAQCRRQLPPSFAELDAWQARRAAGPRSRGRVPAAVPPGTPDPSHPSSPAAPAAPGETGANAS